MKNDIESVVNELVPELKPVETKQLNLGRALIKVWNRWNGVFNPDKSEGNLGWFSGVFTVALVISFFGVLISLIDPLSPDASGHYRSLEDIRDIFWMGKWGCRVFPVLASSWIIQATWMLIWHKEALFVPVLPSVKEVQRRSLERMRSEVEKARLEVEGSDSAVEKRIAELKKKRERANVVRQYFRKRFGDTRNEEHGKLSLQALEVRKALDMEIKTLTGEQESVLALFREVETSIPMQEASLADDSYAAELAELRGEAVRARLVSREMLMQAIAPSIERLLVLNQAREHLLSRSLSILDGPLAVEKFLSGVEQTSQEAAKFEGTLKRLGETSSPELVS